MTTQLFYQSGLIKLFITDAEQRTLLRHQQIPLAEHAQSADAKSSTLLVSDHQSSVLHRRAPAHQTLNYSPYGYISGSFKSDPSLGFNGELRDPATSHYLLGSYRLYSPVLMRFSAPDSWSPFGLGGINTYAYCSGDPVNQSDPSGHVRYNNRTYLGPDSISTPSKPIPILKSKAPLRPTDWALLNREPDALSNPKYFDAPRPVSPLPSRTPSPRPFNTNAETSASTTQAPNPNASEVMPGWEHLKKVINPTDARTGAQQIEAYLMSNHRNITKENQKLKMIAQYINSRIHPNNPDAPTLRSLYPSISSLDNKRIRWSANALKKTIVNRNHVPVIR